MAAQIQVLGAGLALDSESASGVHIREAVDEVLTNPSYIAVVQRLAEMIAASPGASKAATRLEELSRDAETE